SSTTRRARRPARRSRSFHSSRRPVFRFGSRKSRSLAEPALEGARATEGLGMTRVVAALGMTAIIAGCELGTVNIPKTTPTVVVHGVLNPSAPNQVILLERTLTGAVRIPDTSFDASDPIVSAGGIAIS